MATRYRAAIWLGAGQGCRLGEVLDALRHLFATTLITNHVEPQMLQRMLRHKTLRIAQETYVHWWPKRDRPAASWERSCGRPSGAKIKPDLYRRCTSQSTGMRNRR
ncbi:hypothetical protein GCM10023176_22850 [Micromonospora coerulea]|uniref:Tyr recombinase domain-containing protein n=1 Tax=Micromonospora coerulea TaxID=47856 RepID=A0ABP8SGY8_9ACTN